jgi:transcriptional regulator with XRE-family HTH domain
VEHDELDLMKRKLQKSMSRKQVAECLGMTERTVSKLWASGHLQYFKYKDKPRSTREQIADYLKMQIEGYKHEAK